MKRKRKRKQKARTERISILIMNEWFTNPQGNILDFGKVFIDSYIASQGGDDKQAFARALKGHPPIASVNQVGSTTLFGRVKLTKRLESFCVARTVPTGSDDAKRYLDDIKRGKPLVADQYGKTEVEQRQWAEQMERQDYINITMMLCQTDLTYQTTAPSARAKAIDNVHYLHWERLTALPLNAFQHTFGTFLYNVVEWIRDFRDDQEMVYDVDGDSKWVPPDADLVRAMESESEPRLDIGKPRGFTI